MTTLTELLDLAYKMGHEDGWRQRDEFNKKRLEFSKDRIIDICCKYFDMAFEEMTGRTRKSEIAIPRQITAYLLAEYTTLGPLKIGRLMNRDHSTAIYNRETISALIKTDKEVAADVSYLVSAISYELSGEPANVVPKPKHGKMATATRGRPKGSKNKSKAPVVKIRQTRPPSHYSNRSPYGIASGLR